MTQPFYTAQIDVAVGTRGKATDINNLDSAVEQGFKNAHAYGIDSGTSAAYVVTMDTDATAYYDGMVVSFAPDNTNSVQSPTINVNGLGAKSTSSANQLSGVVEIGEIKTGYVYTFVYYLTGFVLQGSARLNTIPGPIGSGTPSTGAFTTLSASSTVSGAGFSAYLASPPAIGGTAPAAVSGTTITGKAGSGTGAPVMIGTLYVNATPVGNVGVGEDTLMSYSLPANSLSANGKAVRVKMWGYTSSNANVKQVNFYFGSEFLQGFAPTTNELNYWTVEIIMVRYAVAVQTKYIHTTSINNNVVALADISVGSATEDETAAILIRATGQGTDNDDVVQSGMLVEFIN